MDSCNDLLYLPVSLGEAIDKLTILDIKIEKINDHRKTDVQNEYNLLYSKLQDFIFRYNDLYQSMKKVNLLIWNMMDILRDGDISNEEYLKVCKECVEYNDIRFRIKNKINYASSSLLKEQKSYKVNRIIIEIAVNIEDIENFIRPIKYYSFFYDEIVIRHCSNSMLKEHFHYDPTIVFTDNHYENAKKYFTFTNGGENEIKKIFEITDEIMNTLLSPL
jgi:hypothetical protein